MGGGKTLNFGKPTEINVCHARIAINAIVLVIYVKSDSALFLEFYKI